MYAVLANATVPGHHDVKLAVRVKQHLHLVENVIAIRAIREVDLCHVDVPGALALVVVHLVLLLILEVLVNRDVV